MEWGGGGRGLGGCGRWASRSNFHAESQVAYGRVRAERDTKHHSSRGFGFVSLFHTRRGSKRKPGVPTDDKGVILSGGGKKRLAHTVGGGRDARK